MIEVQQLTKHYGTLAAVQEVSFSVAEGEIVGFLGPNGAGKSTTMRVITGFSPATSGTVRVAGFDVHETPIEVKRRIGYLPERVPLYEEMAVEAFLRYVAEIKGVPRSARKASVGEAMERCGVSHMSRRLIGHLSKGYRQRVGLAQALVGKPPVLILDEPTVGLDPAQIVEIRNMIKSLGGDHTVLISTHILPEVAMLCGRAVIIHQGRVVVEADLASLTEADSAPELIFELQGAESSCAEALAAAAPKAAITREADGGWCVRGAGIDAASICAVLASAGIGIRGVSRRRRSLEEVFMAAVAGDREAGA